MKNREELPVTRGSQNVFKDLGVRDPETHLVKAALVSRVHAILRERRLTQAQAARLLGLSQPDVSRLLKGSFRDVSVERLLRLLRVLGRDVEITIRKPRSARLGRVRVAAG